MPKLYFLVVVGLLCLVVANAWPQYRRGEPQPGIGSEEEIDKESPPSEDKSGKKCKVKDAKGEGANQEDKSTEEERVFNLLRQLYERGSESKEKTKESRERNKKKCEKEKNKKNENEEQDSEQQEPEEPEQQEPEEEPEQQKPEQQEPEEKPEQPNNDNDDTRAVLESLRTLLRRRFRK